MLYLYIGAAAALVLSVTFSREKTLKALKSAYRKFIKIVPPFLVMTILVAAILYFVSDELIVRVLGGENIFRAVGFSALLGSVALIPGFIVFPLCGILREQGVPYTILSSFTTTLMMVGIITFPVEKEYLGARLALFRNLCGILMAAAVAVITGLFFGEIG